MHIICIAARLIKKIMYNDVIKKGINYIPNAIKGVNTF